MDRNNDLLADKMKCKRCRAYVPDDSNVCPMCGEDLTFLRELLKSVYEEDPKPTEPQISPGPLKEPVKEVREKPPGKPGEPRVILNSDPIDLGADYRVTFSLADGLGPEGPAWDHALRGGFWRRLCAFEVDLLFLVLLLAIFIVAGLIAAEWGAAEDGMSLLKRMQAIVILTLPLAVVLGIVYFSFFHAAWGQTIGKMIFRVRVVQTSGEPLTFPRALLRTLAYLISALPVFLGFIWMGFTSGKRAWHDLISGTIVVREQ